MWCWVMKWEVFLRSAVIVANRCTGPRSKDILTSGLERLVPGEELPSPHKGPEKLAVERRTSGYGNQVASDIDSDEDISYDGSSQQPGVGHQLA